MSATQGSISVPRPTQLTDRNATIVRRSFAAALTLFGLLAFFTTIHIIIRTYSPVMFWDQWDVVRTLADAHHHLTLAQLWAPHNEHRILVGRLFCIADLKLFGGKNLLLLALTFLIQSTLLVLYSGVVVRWSNLRRETAIAVCGFIAYCCFSPLQIKNFVWAFQATFVPVFLAAAITFVLAVRTTAAATNKKRRAALFACCILAALCTEGTIASGLFVWPALLLLFFLASAARWQIGGTAIAMAVGSFAFFWHYPKPGAGLAEAAHPNLVNVTKFVLTQLAFSWDAAVPNPSHWPSVSESLSLLAILFAIAYVYRCIRHRVAINRLDLFLCANLIFLLLTLVSIGFGRIRFGLEQATESRYQTVSLLFWASIAILIAVQLAEGKRGRARAAVACFACLLLLAVPSRYPGAMAWALAQQQQLARGWNALMEGATDDNAIAGLYPDHQKLRELFAYLRVHHWGPDGLIGPDGKTTLKIPAQMGGSSPDRGKCLGYVDSVKELGNANVVISGWAADKRSPSSPARVAIVSYRGTVIGLVKTGSDRPDVARQHPEFDNGRTGWNVDLAISDDSKYRAVVLTADGKSECELAGVAIQR